MSDIEFVVKVFVNPDFTNVDWLPSENNDIFILYVPPVVWLNTDAWLPSVTVCVWAVWALPPVKLVESESLPCCAVPAELNNSNLVELSANPCQLKEKVKVSFTVSLSPPTATAPKL